MTKREAYNKLRKILKENNVELNFWGCGCCGSPAVDLEIDGVHLLDNEENANFFMDEKVQEEHYKYD